VSANAGKGNEARYIGEFMGVEAVHRALTRQSLGNFGSDRAFMRYEFTDIMTPSKPSRPPASDSAKRARPRAASTTSTKSDSAPRTPTA
jgi:hypothetical protein